MSQGAPYHRGPRVETRLRVSPITGKFLTEIRIDRQDWRTIAPYFREADAWAAIAAMRTAALAFTRAQWAGYACMGEFWRLADALGCPQSDDEPIGVLRDLGDVVVYSMRREDLADARALWNEHLLLSDEVNRRRRAGVSPFAEAPLPDPS